MPNTINVLCHGSRVMAGYCDHSLALGSGLQPGAVKLECHAVGQLVNCSRAVKFLR